MLHCYNCLTLPQDLQNCLSLTFLLEHIFPMNKSCKDKVKQYHLRYPMLQWMKYDKCLLQKILNNCLHLNYIALLLRVFTIHLSQYAL